MKALAAIFAALMALSAYASPGLWYVAERPGHGLSLHESTGGTAVLWFLHRRDGSATFLIGEPCAELPCVTTLYQPTAAWLGGDLDLGEPIGTLELQPDGDNLRAVYDLRGLSPELCDGSPGGLLFNQCVGRLTLTRLAE